MDPTARTRFSLAPAVPAVACHPRDGRRWTDSHFIPSASGRYPRISSVTPPPRDGLFYHPFARFRGRNPRISSMLPPVGRFTVHLPACGGDSRACCLRETARLPACGRYPRFPNTLPPIHHSFTRFQGDIRDSQALPGDPILFFFNSVWAVTDSLPTFGPRGPQPILEAVK